MSNSLKLKYVRESIPVRRVTELARRVVVLLIVETIISVTAGFTVLQLPIIRKEVHLFRWSPLVLISFGILLGLSLVLIKPFQHRKPLNFFMLFTTVTILSMGLGLLFTDADAVEMLVSWIITLLISGLFFIIGFIGRFDITQRATWYLIYVVTTYSVGTIGAIMLFILKKRSVALLLQGVSAVSGFAPGMMFAAQIIQDDKTITCPPDQYILAAFGIWSVLIVIEYGVEVGVVTFIADSQNDGIIIESLREFIVLLQSH